MYVFDGHWAPFSSTVSESHVGLGLDVGSVLQQEGYCLGMTVPAGQDEGCFFLLTVARN